MDTEAAYTQQEKEDNIPVFSVQKKCRYREKFVYLASIINIMTLSHAVVYAQWILPFYYAVVTPILIVIRIVMYWKNKWQYFLLEFCYFANVIWYAFIWIADDPRIFAVVFALANGPLVWAMVVYRNSLVFHNTDKVTSTYIHFFPSILSFSIRWFATPMSSYWFKSFVAEPLPPDFSIIIWLILIPQGLFMLHSGLYFLAVHVIKKPSDEYLSSFSYLGTKKDSCLYKLFNACGERCRCFMFYLFNWIFCVVTLIGVVLCYQFFIAHCILVIGMMLLTVWNGGMYYIDVFSVRGFAVK